MRPFSLVLAASLLLVGCLPPITPMERLQQSAWDVAGAMRFGRTDLVAEYVANTARDAFLARHAVWADKTRVVDLELSGIYLRTADEAESVISISWLRSDGAMLHTTEISMRWTRENGSFRIVDEVFRAGDKALFDMLPKTKSAPGKPKPAPAPDAQAALDDPTKG